MITRCVTYLFLVNSLIVGQTSGSSEKVFRFHSSQEPATVDPVALSEATGGFLFSNLYRSLYRIGPEGQLLPELAKACTWKSSLRLICELKPEARFSNGEPILARHYLWSWNRLVDPTTGSRHGELLQSLENFSAFQDQKPAGTLGARAVNDHTLEIKLARVDPELLFKLASPVLTPLLGPPPVEPDQFSTAITTGPYRFKGWTKQTRVELETNPFYFAKGTRPPVEMLLVAEDATAQDLFDLGKLSFLRRVTVKEIPHRRRQAGFLFTPTFRFDYVGFGPELKELPELRRALTLSLNYPELTKAYLTPGQIGCPSLPRRLATPYPCYKFDLAAARKALAKVPMEARKRRWTLAFSKASGEDVARGMEWMQAQWKKHLDIKVDLKPMENGVYGRELKASPPALFRRGINLERPTCAAALELFISGGGDNFIRFADSSFDDLVERLESATTPSKKARRCGEGLKKLMDQHVLIPLGELYFAMIGPPDFVGWKISPLNQLDLTELSAAPEKPKKK